MLIEAESPEQFGYERIRFNLAESSVSDVLMSELAVDLDGLILRYGDHLGTPELRAAIAAGGPGLDPGDVIVTPGAAAALFIVATSILEPGDHVVVARPNYATNPETPRAIGADVGYLELTYEEGWQVDPARIAALMTPRTKLVSLTSPHNPTGSVISEAVLRDVIALVERSGARLLLDETYREISAIRVRPRPIAARTRGYPPTSGSSSRRMPDASSSKMPPGVAASSRSFLERRTRRIPPLEMEGISPQGPRSTRAL